MTEAQTDHGFVPASSYNYVELLKCAEGSLFGEGNAQLPAPPMLMIDEISNISAEGGNYGKGFIHAKLGINPERWFFDCHFKHDPVMPGCLGLDAMWQLIGFFLGWRGHPGHGRALGCGKVRFTGQVLTEIKLVEYFIHIKKVINRPLILGVGDAELLADGKATYQASDLRVGLFTKENLQ